MGKPARFAARAGAVALLWSAASASMAVPECDIEVHAATELYVVTVDGAPFKNKLYIDHEDAIRLRDVLVQSGECNRPKRLRACGVQPADGGGFTVTRGGSNLGFTTVYATYDAARRHAKKLAAGKLCRVE